MGPADLEVALRSHGVSARVRAAMAGLPREQFVPAPMRRHAWEDRPLPIGFGQTISQPSLVGTMLDMLELQPSARVLDVGTGSGYQAAVLAALGAEVLSIERIPALAERAARTLARLSPGVEVRCADGSRGWPERAPFDAIVVAAAADSIPGDLGGQLGGPGAAGHGGRLVMPVRDDRSGAGQRLVLLQRTAGGLVRRDLMPVVFVPLVVDP